MKLKWEFFHAMGLNHLNRSLDGSQFEQDRIFQAHFGTSWFVCAATWNALDEIESTYIQQQAKLKPIHLLWAFYFLKRYETEDVGGPFWGVTPKTFRKWVWIMLTRLEELSIEKVEFVLLFHFSFIHHLSYHELFLLHID